MNFAAGGFYVFILNNFVNCVLIVNSESLVQINTENLRFMLFSYQF